MEKRHGGGGGGFTVLCIVVAFLLPRPAGAADAKWHAHRPVAGTSNGGAVTQWTPAPLPLPLPLPHHALPPLSAPPPTAGADLPHFGFPLQPTLGSAAPPGPAAVGTGGEGYPFIGSNPTVPLPTGMTDTATVLPLPDTGDATTATKVVGLAASGRAHVSMIGLGVCLAILVLFQSTTTS